MENDMRSITIGNKNHRNCHEYVNMLLMIAALCFVFFSTGCSSLPGGKVDSGSDIEKQWGVKIESIRVTAAGHLVDFRYRVLDSEKAMVMMKRGDKAYIIDQASGLELPVPVTKVGPIRGTGTTPKEGKVYSVMFKNGGIVQSGSKVTVVIGDFKVEDLIVE
jgi:hypothetical protein